ncbi:lipopolysaccharide biosynthesis protein [Rufibacter quisquiliarum]|nr:lipopolysaccharide biosynthesis protein [Rufibacter quisquiliarum]
MFLKGIYWDFLEKVLNQGIGLIVSIILARLLSPEDFGFLSMVMVIVTFANAFMDMGFSTALVQKQEITEEQYSTVFYLNLMVGLLLSVLIFASSGMVSDFYGEPSLAPLIQGISPVFLLNAFALIQTSKLLKAIDLKPLAIYRGIAVAVSGAIGIAMAYLGYGVWSLVAQSLLNTIIFTLLLWLFSPWQPTWTFNLSSVRELWAFGSKIFLPTVLENIFSRLDVFIIGKIFNASSLGYYTRAQSLNSLVVHYSSGSITKVFFSVISRHQHDIGKVVSVYKKSLVTVSFLAFILLSILYVSADHIILLLFTSKWSQSIVYFRIMLLGGFAYPLSSIMVNLISGRGNSSAFLKLDMIKKSILLLVFIIGFQMGITAYLYGMVIFYFISVLVNMLFVSRDISLSMGTQARMIVPYFLLAFISGFAAMQIKTYLLLPRILMLGLEASTILFLYIGLNLIFRTEASLLIKEKFSNILSQKGK